MTRDAPALWLALKMSESKSGKNIIITKDGIPVEFGVRVVEIINALENNAAEAKSKYVAGWIPYYVEIFNEDKVSVFRKQFDNDVIREMCGVLGYGGAEKTFYAHLLAKDEERAAEEAKKRLGIVMEEGKFRSGFRCSWKERGLSGKTNSEDENEG